MALGPDVILAQGGTAVAALQQASRSIPIVFAVVVDPVGAGLVSNLARPGSNTTGFMDNEYGTSGKWVELLKQVAPRVTRVAVMRDPAVATGIGQFGQPLRYTTGSTHLSAESHRQEQSTSGNSHNARGVSPPARD